MTLAGLVLAAISLLPAIIGAGDDLQLYRLLTVTLGSLVVLSIAALIYVIWVLSQLSQQHAEAVAKVAKIESEAYYTDAHTLSIANQFAYLVGEQKDFEASVAAYVWRFFLNEDTKDDWDTVTRHWFRLIQMLCDTAAYVISVKKGYAHDKCSANIKTFSAGSDRSNPEYRVLARSTHSAYTRRQADSSLKDAFVRKNRMYHEILEKASHLLVKDARTYVEDTSKFSMFVHPSADALNFYSSCLVCPIQGKDPVTRGLKVDEILEFGDGASLVGLFCIDAMEADFFDDEYDLGVMTQLCDHAFGAIRALHALNGLRRRRDEERTKVFART